MNVHVHEKKWNEWNEWNEKMIYVMTRMKCMKWNVCVNEMQ